MSDSGTVVADAQPLTNRKFAPLTRLQLHAKIMLGFSRAIDKLGRGVFLEKIDCTSEGLRKQMNGGLPSLEVLDRAFDADPMVLDDWMHAKGVRIVSEDAACDTDDLNLLLARALVKINEVTHPDSPGGRAIVHTEYLGGEDLMRQIHSASATWLQQCAKVRGDHVVSISQRGAK